MKTKITTVSILLIFVLVVSKVDLVCELEF